MLFTGNSVPALPLCGWWYLFPSLTTSTSKSGMSTWGGLLSQVSLWLFVLWWPKAKREKRCVISLSVGYNEFLPLYSFQSVLATLETYPSHVNFGMSLSVSTSSLGHWMGIVLNLHQFGRELASLLYWVLQFMNMLTPSNTLKRLHFFSKIILYFSTCRSYTYFRRYV